MQKLISRFVKDEDGATAIEYGLIAGLITVGIVTLLGNIGGDLKGVFTDIDNALK